MVNIWGSNDRLALGNIIGGYVDHIGEYSGDDQNKPLFNIEIEGADHYDYIRGVFEYEEKISDPVELMKAQKKNKIVSEFVAKTILRAKSAADFKLYMIDLQNKGIASSTGKNTWRIDLGL